MNRQSLVLVTIFAALGVFVVGALYYSPWQETKTSVMPATNEVPLIRPYSPILGAEGAPVTIVEFFDPACESCRAFHPAVKEILSKYEGKVRVVLRYTAFHPPSEEAIRALETARIQGKFNEVLERLLETQSVWAPHGRPAQGIWDLLSETGLDIERALRDAKLPGIVAVLIQDAADVKEIGVRGTPTFFVNGKPLKELGHQQLEDLVKSEIELLEGTSEGKPASDG